MLMICIAWAYVKKPILSSLCPVQHPNTGQNIQQLVYIQNLDFKVIFPNSFS